MYAKFGTIARNSALYVPNNFTDIKANLQILAHV